MTRHSAETLQPGQAGIGPAGSPSDPDGLYAILGIGPLAERAEIKAAYRHRTRTIDALHNPAESAGQEQDRLDAAYGVLSSRKKRALYDARTRYLPPWLLVDPDDPAPKAVACRRCGKVSAQPRYVVFEQTRGLLFRTRRTFFEGVFCRDCADLTAIRASTRSWLAGWWSVTGPVLTLAALLRNLAGGRKPRTRNLWLLTHQARAFLAEGDTELAHAIARHALSFAVTPAERGRIEAACPDFKTGRLVMRNRWRGHWRAAMIQSLPLLALAAALGLGTALILSPRVSDRGGAEIVIPPANAGDIRHAAIDALKIRQAPSAGAPVVALLDRFTHVLVLDPQGGEWVRIATPAGIAGYAPARLLFGGDGSQARNQWCESNRGTPPANGEVLWRGTGGEHTLAIANQSGQDLVVKLKTPGGAALLSVFVAANDGATVEGIPQGSFHSVLASGADFSRACGVFLESMRIFAGPALASALPGAQIVIPAGALTDGQAGGAPLSDFLDQ